MISLGQVCATANACRSVREHMGADVVPEIFIDDLLPRHASGDWGVVDDHDRRVNDDAVKNGGRILSAYDILNSASESLRVWIITEADRSATTVLLPEDY